MRLNNAPQATGGGGFRPADHVDSLVLFQTGPVSTFETRIGPSEGMKCPNVVTVNDDGTYVEHGPSLLFPQVIVDSLSRFDPGAWVSGRLDQTNRWYSLEPVDDDKLELLERVLDVVDPPETKPAPAAVGAVAAPVIEQDPF